VRELWRDRLHIWRNKAPGRAHFEIQPDPFATFRLLSLAAAAGKLFFRQGMDTVVSTKPVSVAEIENPDASAAEHPGLLVQGFPIVATGTMILWLGFIL
jgi:hypothetical protein